MTSSNMRTVLAVLVTIVCLTEIQPQTINDPGRLDDPNASKTIHHIVKKSYEQPRHHHKHHNEREDSQETYKTNKRNVKRDSVEERYSDESYERVPKQLKPIKEEKEVMKTDERREEKNQRNKQKIETDTSEEYERSVESKHGRYEGRHKRQKVYVDSSDESLSTIEVPVKRPIKHRWRRQYNDYYYYDGADRPFFNFLLGILDTVKSHNHANLRRAYDRDRRRRANDVVDKIQDVAEALLPRF